MADVTIRPGDEPELQRRHILSADLAGDLVAEQAAAAGVREEVGR